jgi:hypothetical protein
MSDTVIVGTSNTIVEVATQGPQGAQVAQGAQGEGETTINQFLLMGA